MSRSSRSVYTVTRHTYLTAADEMSDIAFIDVDDDSCADGDLSSAPSAVKPLPGSLYEAKHQVSDHQRDLSERGVFDYFSSPLTLRRSGTNVAEDPSFRPQNHCYLGPGCSSLQQSSGVRKFVEAHRQADTTSSDEEVGNSHESRWPASSHRPNIQDSASLDSQWVRQQYNNIVRHTNTQGYDEAMLCHDADDCLTENRPISPASAKQTHPVDFLSSCSNVQDKQHVRSRHTFSDMGRDICDKVACLKFVKDDDSFRDNNTLCSDLSDVSSRADQRTDSTQSFLLRSSGGRNVKDVGDTVSRQLSSLGQSWPILAGSSESHSGHATVSHQNAVCRSSELLSPTVVSSVGSVRCSTGVDTGIGFPLSTVSSRSSQGLADVSRLSSSGQGTVTSGVHRAASNGLQAIADYRKNYDGVGPRSHVPRSAICKMMFCLSHSVINLIPVELCLYDVDLMRDSLADCTVVVLDGRLDHFLPFVFTRATLC